MCSSCMCVLNMCFAACSGLGDTHTHTTVDNICLWNNEQFINSFALLNMYASTNFHVHWGYLRKCSFSIGFFKAAAAHIVSEFYLNSLWVQKLYGNQSKCWNVQPSCSSHHVECTKTWMRDVSSVLWGDRTLFFEVRQPTHTCPAEHLRQEQSNGSWW